MASAATALSAPQTLLGRKPTRAALASRPHRAQTGRRTAVCHAQKRETAQTLGQGVEQRNDQTELSLSLSRRAAVVSPLAVGIWAGLAAALGPLVALPAAASPAEAKNIIITGSNSGIGLDAATKLVAKGHKVFLACRTMAKAEAAKEAIMSASPGASGAAVPMECDLASMTSIRSFVDAFKATGERLDVLCLNAGLQYSGVTGPTHRTADGFEETVGVNHLGHFLLANLLLPELEAAGKEGPEYARVVVTASEVHDPSTAGGSVGAGATLGDLHGLAENGKAFEMLDGGEYDPDKAYKDSKLCNVLFARELQRRVATSGARLTVNSYGPGLITRTGFFRNQQPIFVKLFDFATNDIFKVAETVDGAGNCLVFMVTSESLEGVGGVYYNNGIPGPGQHKFEQKDPSQEARSDDEAALLWKLSSGLVGLDA